MKVETERCEINTVNVTLRAIHVDKKQMTLSVFRQLPYINIDGVDIGVLDRCNWWGFVNYAIKGEGMQWVVFDLDGILFRCPLYQLQHTKNIAYYNPQIEALKKDIEKNKAFPLFTVQLQNELNLLHQKAEDIASFNKAVSIVEKLPQLFIAV